MALCRKEWNRMMAHQPTLKYNATKEEVREFQEGQRREVEERLGDGEGEE